MRFIHLIPLLILLGGCAHSSQEDKYAEIVSQWQGREIKLPAVMTDFLTGDTINLDDADFTILTYVDSAGCTGCKMKLPLWNEFIGGIDSISGDYEIIPMIAVNAKDKEGLIRLIQSSDYRYPIVIDTTDSINTINNFPKESGLRTLLLNRNKQVLAIGNPITNNNIAELYRSLISGSMTFSSSGVQVISASPFRISLGEIQKGCEKSAQFTINNKGRDTVHIREVITSCPCTEAYVSSATIPPGENIPVTVKFKEDSIIGEFERTIHIFYHNFDNPTVLGLTGTVL